MAPIVERPTQKETRLEVKESAPRIVTNVPPPEETPIPIAAPTEPEIASPAPTMISSEDDALYAAQLPLVETSLQPEDEHYPRAESIAKAFAERLKQVRESESELNSYQHRRLIYTTMSPLDLVLLGRFTRRGHELTEPQIHDRRLRELVSASPLYQRGTLVWEHLHWNTFHREPLDEHGQKQPQQRKRSGNPIFYQKNKLS
jgi:hypothetical protein